MRFTNRAQARSAIFEFVEVFYNRQRCPLDDRDGCAGRVREELRSCAHVIVHVSGERGQAQGDPPIYMTPTPESAPPVV